VTYGLMASVAGSEDGSAGSPGIGCATPWHTFRTMVLARRVTVPEHVVTRRTACQNNGRRQSAHDAGLHVRNGRTRRHRRRDVAPAPVQSAVIPERGAFDVPAVASREVAATLAGAEPRREGASTQAQIPLTSRLEFISSSTAPARSSASLSMSSSLTSSATGNGWRHLLRN